MFLAGLAGAGMGLLAGSLIGGACFPTVIKLQGQGRGGPECESFGCDPIAVRTALRVAWGLVGSGLGASLGAVTGASWLLHQAPGEGAWPAAMAGAFLALPLGAVGWLFPGRTRRDGSPADEGRRQRG